MPITLYIKNALHASELGLGDGTIYASGTVNLEADISQANNTFTLTGFTLDALTGTDTDDLMNGYLLYFPSSGNKYHVVDWVAATDTATTHEMPQLTDTGACEFRRALFDNKALASNPLLYAADGLKIKKWDSASLPTIDLYLPNHISNGGFEAGISGWAITRVGGTTDTTGINTTSPILGSNDLKIDKGDRTKVKISTPLSEKLFSGRKYRVLLKARRSAGTFVDGDFRVSFKDTFANIRPELPTFTNQSSGTVSGTEWNITPTTTNTWHWADINVNDDIGGGFVHFGFEIFSNLFTVNVDEIYIFERINVNSLIVYDHNSYHFWTVTGKLCAKDRVGFSSGIDDSILLGSTTVLKDPFFVEFTGGIFPIYELNNTTVSIPSASEILLCEKWAWEFNPDIPFDAESIEYDEKTIKTRSGVESTIRHSKKITVKGKYSKMSGIDRAILRNDFFPHHIDEARHPFTYRLNATGTPLFVRVSQSKFGLNRSSGLLDDWDFAFDEVL